MVKSSMTILAAGAFALLCTSGPSLATDNDWRSLPRADMLEEDSHPHEIQPGAEARFHTLPQARPAVIDAKCSLTGPATKALIETSDMTLRDWPLPSTTFDIRPGETLWVDVVAIVSPTMEKPPYFAFRNLDASRLLWHQCYNN